MDLWISVALLIAIIIIILFVYRYTRSNKHPRKVDDTDGMFLLNKGKHEDER